jgi:hypothetical protein
VNLVRNARHLVAERVGQCAAFYQSTTYFTTFPYART